VSLDVVAHGEDVATAFAVFAVTGTGARVHQSQVWSRIDGQWRVAAAHVSNA
jgi:hypothetical protein